MITHPEPGSTLNGDPYWKTFQINDAKQVLIHVAADGLVCLYVDYNHGQLVVSPSTEYQPTTVTWKADSAAEPVTLRYDEEPTCSE